MGPVPLLIAGDWVRSGKTAPLEDKYRGEPIAEIVTANREQVRAALQGLRRAQEQGPLHPYRRYEILAAASRLVDERRDELVQTIVAESGFTVQDATGEVDRAVQTLLLSGEEAKRLDGEMVPLDGAPGVSGRIGFTVRRPVGVVCAITPFNSPLNTVAHKLGPAIAAGNCVALKPALATPATAARLCEILVEAGLPPDRIALVHGSGGNIGAWLLQAPEVDFYTFTGSTEVGRTIQRTVGLRRTQLELGSISSTIVCDDADLDVVVPRCVAGAFRKAGQVCTSVQRLYVDARVVDAFVARLADELVGRGVGDPSDPGTFVGPLISVAEAERVERWVADAARSGAKVVVGGERDRAVVRPAVLLGTDRDMKVVCQEVFGPVVSILPFDDLDDAIDDANATPYGLAAGLFTRDLERALTAATRLRVGSVHVNQTSSARVDLMPYGGVKDSGFGREGPKYAAREMTEEQLITISLS